MIECTNLTFSYPGGEPIITGLDWTFHPGSTTAVTGPSGKGKSTLLYLLGLLLTPSSGEVRIDNEPVSEWSDARRSAWRGKEIGFVFQDAALDATRSVIDNIVETSVYGPMDRRTAVSSGLDLMDELGVDVPATRKPGQVSGGQAQRIAMCRALVSDPSVLLGDEPTGNLDSATADVVIDKMRTAAADGRTVVIATHDQNVVEICDQVLEL